MPEKLGRAHMPTACSPAVSPRFDRALALLHSFAYARAWEAFHAVQLADPQCAMAWWGMAMTHYHQLWSPAVDSDQELAKGRAEIDRAAALGASPHDRGYIGALSTFYHGDAPIAARARLYSARMDAEARAFPHDDEAQVFDALSLIAIASPSDKTHADDRRAAAMLEPIWRRQPDHPGAPHYLIHAYDSSALARQGLAAARAYAGIAPSAPHALHMPSHIFTRLGLWDDSIASNRAAMAAARDQRDLGEELHAMDYLTYALIQEGRFAEAAEVAAQAQAIAGLPVAVFKVGYAANAIPVRLAVERGDWAAASALQPLPGSPPVVAATVYWARALGHARAAPPTSADADIVELEAREAALKASGDAYWAGQAEIMDQEANAWRAAAQGQRAAAVIGLRTAADEEDSIDKNNVTPGPVVPAREQLGELLLAEDRPKEALAEFTAALDGAPGRRGALIGAMRAARASGDTSAEAAFRSKLAPADR